MFDSTRCARLPEGAHGLGHRQTDNTHYFEELGVHLPRGEIPRKHQMRRELDAWTGAGPCDVACGFLETKPVIPGSGGWLCMLDFSPIRLFGPFGETLLRARWDSWA